MRNETNAGLRAVCAAGTALLAASALAVDVTRTPAAVLVKPDLTVTSVQVERIGVAANGDHRVRIRATVVCNAAPPTSCGPFKLLADWWDLNPATPENAQIYYEHPIPSTRLGEAGVAGLNCGRGATSAVPTALRTFDGTVPSGGLRVFRVTADSAGQVAESNEGNNSKAARYYAAACIDADLALTRIELIRATTGGTLVHVWVRNRCADPCAADMYYTVDDLQQMIGTRIDGLVEAGPLGNIGAPGIAGRDATYTVSVEARGGSCPDRNRANNSHRVTIRASEPSRTFYFNP
jgi:hypothetical protein